MTPCALKLRREEREMAELQKKRLADIQRMYAESYEMDLRRAKAQADFEQQQMLINTAIGLINAVFVDHLTGLIAGLALEPKK